MKKLLTCLSLLLALSVCASGDTLKGVRNTIRDIRKGENNRNQIEYLRVEKTGVVQGVLSVGGIITTGTLSGGTLSPDTIYATEVHVAGDGGTAPDLTVSNGNFMIASTQGWSTVDANTEFDTGSSAFRFGVPSSLGWDISTVNGGATLQIGYATNRISNQDNVLVLANDLASVDGSLDVSSEIAGGTLVITNVGTAMGATIGDGVRWPIVTSGNTNYAFAVNGGTGTAATYGYTNSFGMTWGSTPYMVGTFNNSDADVLGGTNVVLILEPDTTQYIATAIGLMSNEAVAGIHWIAIQIHE